MGQANGLAKFKLCIPRNACFSVFDGTDRRIKGLRLKLAGLDIDFGKAADALDEGPRYIFVWVLGFKVVAAGEESDLGRRIVYKRREGNIDAANIIISYMFIPVLELEAERLGGVNLIGCN